MQTELKQIYQPQMNMKVIDSISALLKKVESQTIQNFSKINLKINDISQVNNYEHLAQIIMQSNNIYNLCLQQIRQELINNNMESLSIQFQKIFNGQNSQLNYIISQQLNLVKSCICLLQNKEYKPSKKVDLLNQKTNNIPPNKRNLGLGELTLEQKILIEMQQDDQLKKENEIMVLETKRKLQKTQNELTNCEIEGNKNIQNIENSLLQKKRLEAQGYSGAIGMYSKINRGVNNDNLLQHLGLNLFCEFESDDEDLTQDERRQRRILKKQQKEEQKRLIIYKIQIGEFKEAQLLLIQQYDKDYKELKERFEKIQDIYEAAKNIAKQGIDYLKKCKVKCCDHDILIALSEDLENLEKNYQDNSLAGSKLKSRKAQYKDKLKDINTIYNRPDGIKSSFDESELKSGMRKPISEVDTPMMKFDSNQGKKIVKKPSKLDNVVLNQKPVDPAKLPPEQKIYSQMVDKQVTQHFIMKNGKKIEVFQNEKGEFFRKDKNGKIQILEDKDMQQVFSETKTIQVQQNFIIDKSGKKQEILLDDKGNPYYVGEDGVKVRVPKQIQKKQNYQEVFQDKNGKQYILNKEGKKQEVFVNESGQQYILNANGEKELINMPVFEVYVPQVQVDADGKKFITNDKGQKQEVFLNDFGEECVMDDNGFVVPINQIYKNPNNPLSKVQQQIYTNENGEKFILGKDGERMIVKTDENGNTYFEDKNGRKQMLPKEAIQDDKEPIFMNEAGETYIKDKNGNIQKIEVDQFGQQFLTNANGERVLRGEKKPLNFQVHKGENGEQFIIDKSGKRVQVKTDILGNQYVISDDGQKIIINQSSNPVQPKIDISKKQIKNAQILKDESGKMFIKGKNGEKIEVKMNADGKPFFLDKNGNIQMVNAQDQAQVLKNADGTSYVMVNGEKRQIKFNENGQQYFINADGKQEIIRQLEEEQFESEDEQIPEYIDEKGFCKYCKAKYVHKPKNFKGEVFEDEKGERYILDKYGNKIYVQVNLNGQMYYIDANGVMILIPFGGKIKKDGWMRIKAANQIIYDNNIKKYDKIGKRFKTDDKELLEKVSYLDEKTQNKILESFNSDEFYLLKTKIALIDLQGVDIVEMYELLRVIAGNYKMSDSEFASKIRYFKRQHEQCGDSCQHGDLFLKQMIVQNNLNKTIQKIGQTNLYKLFEKFKRGSLEKNLQTMNLHQSAVLNTVESNEAILNDKQIEIENVKTIERSLSQSMIQNNQD